jgi:hypothetical protein
VENIVYVLLQSLLPPLRAVATPNARQLAKEYSYIPIRPIDRNTFRLMLFMASDDDDDDDVNE